MCDTIAAVGSATAAGTVLFGKNSDRPYDEAQYLEMLPAASHAAGARVHLTYKDIDQARETHAVLLSKPHWIWGAEIGSNEHGLTIGNEAVYSKIEPSIEPGIIGMDYLRLALERSRSVDEGIAVIASLLREHGQSGNCRQEGELVYHNSFILADPRGAKVLETVDREWAVKPIEDYFAISNELTIERFESSSPTLQTRAVEAGLYSGVGPFGFKAIFEDASKTASGCFRQARAMSLLGKRDGELEQADFFNILRDHAEGPRPPDRPCGPRLCAHTRESPLGQTTASWVAALSASPIVHWVTATSAPCTSVFKPLILGLPLPDHGTRPGAEIDCTSLWWRHEQWRRGLEDSGASAIEEFKARRDALEKRFLARMVDCPAPTDAESRLEAERRVEACWREALALEQELA